METLFHLDEFSKEILVPPMDYIDGIYSFQEGNLSFYKSCVAKFIQCLSKKFLKISVPFTEIFPLYKNEISLILILFGEQSVKADWNTEEIVIAARECLNSMLCSFHFGNVNELISQKDLASSVIDNLKPRLQITCVNHYPASVGCLHWITKHITVFSVESYSNVVLPIALHLIKSNEDLNYRKSGLDCIYFILLRSSSSSLNHFGWIEVIFNVLKTCYLNDNISDSVKVFKCLNICLKTLHPMQQNPSYLKDKELWLDQILQELLNQFEALKSDKDQCLFFEILLTFIQSFPLGVIHHLPRIFNIMYTIILADCTSTTVFNAMLEIIHELTESQWISTQLYKNNILWLLNKIAMSISKGDQEEVMEKCLKLTSSLAPDCHNLLINL